MSLHVIFWTVFTATLLHGLIRAGRSRRPRALHTSAPPAAPWKPTTIDPETLARARYVDGRIEVDEFEARIGEVLRERGD